MHAQEADVYSNYAGIDWADKKRDVCICQREKIRESSMLYVTVLKD